MGKRKERRLAALGATGRRVKLDLFAEPSGDLGGSSVIDEVDEDLDQINRAGDPNSPSSSGQPQDNPLLLLGQYSDDELAEEQHKRHKHGDSEVSSSKQNEQVEESKGIRNGNDENSAEVLVDLQAGHVDMGKDCPLTNAMEDMDHLEITESTVSASGDPLSESTTQLPEPGGSEPQVTGGDETSVWKIVMHEESNRYYYWNTETGETSWDVPGILSQGSEAAIQHINDPVPGKTDTNIPTTSNDLKEVLNADSASLAMVESKGANLISRAEDYQQSVKAETWNEDHNDVIRNIDPYMNKTDPKGSEGPTTTADKEKNEVELITNEHHAADLSPHLLEYGESLMGRLKALEGYGLHSEAFERVSKYILELEIRLSDIKSLLDCGLSLLPFWAHSERKLRGLEHAIEDEVSQLAASGPIDTETAPVSCNGDSKASLQCMAEEKEIDELLSTLEHSHASCRAESLKEVEEGDHDRSSSDEVNVDPTPSYESLNRHLGTNEESKMAKVKETVQSAEVALKPVSYSEEDMDMDVDMEVDDEVTASHTASGDVSSAGYLTTVENIVQPSPPVDFPANEDECGVPPPPQEDWIPPPPPDNEPIIPPPPDEPPIPAYPLEAPYPETMQAISYTDPYNFTYPVSGYQYYGPAVPQVSTTNFYANTEGCQITEAQPVQYYQTAATSYSDVAPIMVNPVEPFAYYELPSGNGPIISSVETSAIYAETVPANYPDTFASDRKGTPSVSICSSIPNVKAENTDGPMAGSMTTVQMPPRSSILQATGTNSVNDNIPTSSIYSASASASASTVALSTTVPKAQSKVMRKKKTTAVAPTMRSNKKVSNLVDKWKAAKEELSDDDDDDEPENAYEALEKKKQREIEEWRARQIASGEAKDNANFQPLGGDWRERVKRKRAQSKKESVKTPTEAPANGKQQPDLVQLSKDLPSGWQAYWDESSKEIYYGNIVTSETTWTKPTK